MHSKTAVGYVADLSLSVYLSLTLSFFFNFFLSPFCRKEEQIRVAAAEAEKSVL